MRLLCVTSHADTLNSVRPEAELFIGLQRDGVDVFVMTQEDSPYVTQMRAAGVTVIHQVIRRKLSRSTIGQIRYQARRLAVDAVYAFNNKAICNAAFACIGLPVAFVTYRGQTGNVRRHDPSVYLTHLHPRVDGIIGVSQSVVDDLAPQVRRGVRVDRVYKGHSLDWYTEPALDRSDLEIPEDAFVVGCVANNRPRKGVRYLVEACARLRELERLHLVLVGGGMDAQTLGDAVAEAGLDTRVRLLGLRSDATSVIQACDVAVLPAVRREGLPKTVIEAMAYAVPVVVTDTGGNAELVDHGRSGLVVPPADSAALAGALRQLHDNPDLARRMGATGRERIDSVFNVRETVRQTRDVLEAHIARRQLPA